MLASLGGRDARASDILPVPSTVTLQGGEVPGAGKQRLLTPRGALAQSTAALVSSLAGDKPISQMRRLRLRREGAWPKEMTSQDSGQSWNCFVRPTRSPCSCVSHSWPRLTFPAPLSHHITPLTQVSCCADTCHGPAGVGGPLTLRDLLGGAFSSMASSLWGFVLLFLPALATDYRSSF